MKGLIMQELISRQAAIDALHMDTSIIPFEKAREYADATISEIRNRLEKLPSAEPRRGRWLYCEETTADCVDGYRCDQCGFFVPWDYQHKSIDYIKDYNFCPHCGADMRGEQE